jgi:hypothetical protein
VTFMAANIGYEPDPAGIMLLRGMVEALCGRGSIRFFQTRRHGHVYRIGIGC